MAHLADIEALKDRGAGCSAPVEVARLYDLAFEQYTTRALWSWRHLDRPTIAQALAIAESLRTEGDLAARALAIRIEDACRAAL